MICPKCKKVKVRVLCTITNFEDEEIYRKRRCLRCDYTFYSVEYEVVVNEAFLNKYAECAYNMKYLNDRGERVGE